MAALGFHGFETFASIVHDWDTKGTFTALLASRLWRLVTIGGASARALGDAAIAAGMSRQAVIHFDTSTEAAPAVSSLVTSGDVVLVKGSRGTRTDLVVERLAAVFG